MKKCEACQHIATGPGNGCGCQHNHEEYNDKIKKMQEDSEPRYFKNQPLEPKLFRSEDHQDAIKSAIRGSNEDQKAMVEKADHIADAHKMVENEEIPVGCLLEEKPLTGKNEEDWEKEINFVKEPSNMTRTGYQVSYDPEYLIGFIKRLKSKWQDEATRGSIATIKKIRDERDKFEKQLVTIRDEERNRAIAVFEEVFLEIGAGRENMPYFWRNYINIVGAKILKGKALNNNSPL